MTKWVLLMMTTAAVIALAPAAGAYAKEHEVDIKDVKYKPAKLRIKKGDTVVWINSDDRDHTVVAKDESFDSGKIAAGEKFKHTFEKTGKFEYGCEYHPRMKGVIEVTD